MKAQVIACETSMAGLASVRGGKVSKGRLTEEDLEISLYLDKLSHLVPAAEPKRSSHGKLNRLEVIQSVIDYISDLQEVLDCQHQHDMDLLEYETSSITLAA